MRFCVPIVARRQVNYIVDTADKAEAEQAAIDRFKEGFYPDVCGNEWEEIERVGTIEPVAAAKNYMPL